MNQMIKSRIPASLAPYFAPAPLAAFFLGIASGFPFALLAATLTNRLADAAIAKASISAFALALLVYSFKWAWAPLIDRLTVPYLGERFGQRRSWLFLASAMVAGAVILLGMTDPTQHLGAVAAAALCLGFCGATLDIVIDAYRIELLAPEELGVGAGMSQYGWRIGATMSATIALLVANSSNWTMGYIACAPLVLSAVITAILMGEPPRHHAAPHHKHDIVQAFIAPLRDFFQRHGAWLVLLFVLVHKIGDTMANLMIRDLLVELQFTKPEIAQADIAVGFFALMLGIFVGGILYARMGVKRSVLLSLILMAVSNLSFAALAARGHDIWLLGFTIGFENFASGIGGVVVVAYLSALCNLAFTATQFALLSAAAGIVGRFLTGTTAGTIIAQLGYVDFYLFTTALALPGVCLYLYMSRSGLIDRSLSPDQKN